MNLVQHESFLICRLRGFPVVASPEERVRQAVIAELFALGYPWHLLACEVGHPALRIQGRPEAGRADLLFNLRKDGLGLKADAVIEVKVRAIRPIDHAQAQRYADAFRTSLYALTNGTEWVVAQRTAEGWVPRESFPKFSMLGL